MIALYRQFSQGISVAGCAIMSFVTLGYMVNDIHTNEKKQIKSTYEKQIRVLNEEIDMLKQERVLMKLNYSNKLNLKY
jgi:hypothetical protein